MRKLSKKISMLMVLAMLVSLFSGIVSASAASIWSFYDRTADVVVERNETYVMEKDQYANFDLYREGEEADADIYEYTWVSSDPDVVYVDATNGRLRADKYGKAEAGDKAFVYVLIDNKTTEKNENAKRGFYIEIAADEVVEEPEVEYAIVSNIGEEVYLTGEKYELEAVVTADGEEIEAEVVFSIDGVAITEYAPTKAGEFTIVATATIDGEEYAAEFPVVVEESLPEIVEAKQTALNTVTITFNNADWAKDFASKVKLSYFAGEVEIADLVKSAVAKDEVVTITLYNAMTADTTYKFAYEGYDECVATVKAAKVEPAYIKVVGGKVPQTGRADVKIYTANDVDITSDELKANVTYKSLDENVCDVTGNGDIFFYEIGKSAPVEATYEMGWDADGNEKTDLKDKAVYYSVKEFEYSRPTGFAAGLATADKTKLTYASNATVALDDSYVIYAKYTATKYDGNKTDKYIIGGTDEEGNSYTFYSTNESIVLVNPATGALSPCAVGTASVYLKDANNTVVGSVAIVVKEGRKLNSFTARIDKKQLSTDIVGEYTEAIVSTKDQLNADYTANYSIELVSPLKDAAGNTLTAASFFSNTDALTAADGKVRLVLNTAGALAAIADGKTQTIAFNLKAADPKNPTGNVKSARLSVTIKDMTGTTVNKSTLTVSANSVDTKLNKANAGAYDVNITLVNVDKDNYAKGNANIGFATTASATTGAYTVVISKGNTVYTTGTHFAYNGTDKITIKPVVVSGSDIIKIEAGNYKIQLFKGVNGTKSQPIDVAYVNITDSTPAIGVEVKTDTLTANNEAGVEAALKFVRNGAEIKNTDSEDFIEVIQVVNPVSNISGKYYVKTIKVRTNPKEMKGDANFGGATFVETVTVNKLFKY